jgi:hypothetical protein
VLADWSELRTGAGQSRKPPPQRRAGVIARAHIPDGNRIIDR